MQRSGHLSLPPWWPDSIQNYSVPSVAGCCGGLDLCGVRGEGKLNALCFLFNPTRGYLGASLVAQLVKNPPAMLETWVRSLGGEDPLEEHMAISPVFLPGEAPRTEVPGELWSMGLQRVGHD